MAIIRGPYGTTQIKGSIGATTFQQGPYGLSARSRTTPVNPNSTSQNTIREALRQASSDWALGLTDPERDFWNAYAASLPWSNAFGDPTHLSGRTAFLRQAVFLMNLGYTNQAGASPVPAIMPANNYLPQNAEFTFTAADGDNIIITGVVNPYPGFMYLLDLRFSSNFLNATRYCTGPYPFRVVLSNGSELPDTTFPLDTGIPAGTEGFRRFWALRSYFGATLSLSTIQRGLMITGPPAGP